MPRRLTLRQYGQQLREANRLIVRHTTAARYENAWQIKLADDWFSATLDAMIKGDSLPPRPSALLDHPE